MENMLLEILATLVISTQNIKERVDVNSYNPSTSHSIVGGDSQFQLREKERIAREQSEQRAREVVAREKAQRAVRTSTYQSTGNNPYPWGWCTWFVAQKKGLSQSYGNARNWPVNSTLPQEGSIVVTYESWLGHVGIVKEVNGTQVKIEEMNYAGWGKVSERVVDYRTLPLKGFLVI